ncbi:MAG: acireductone synthase [Leptospira sp.]|nr:acireductone synthase [Leptospira sp.]
MAKKIDGILLDIEGTVGPISFVHEVLFPYSTERMLDFLRNQPLENSLVEEILLENKKDYKEGEFARIENADDPRELNAYLQFLIRQDRKFGPLKTVQGRIWKEGFELGDLKAELFSDVPDFLNKSKSLGYKNFIYSSGSVQAQILFFQYSIFGDLSEYISGYYDTAIGGKKEASSYLNISNATGIAPENFAFFTDIKEEADASLAAGFSFSFIMDRPGNKPQPDHSHMKLKDLFGFFEKL